MHEVTHDYVKNMLRIDG